MGNKKYTYYKIESEEFAFLLHILSSKISEKKIFIPDTLDWKLFLFLVRRHRVETLVYEVFKDSLTQVKIIPILKNHAITNKLNSEHHKRIILELSGLLKQNTIRHFYTKGLILSLKLWGDISTRTVGDIDVIIEKKDRLKVHQLLLDNGYKCKEFKWVNNDRINFHKKFSHQIAYVKQGIVIEVLTDVCSLIRSPEVMDNNFHSTFNFDNTNLTVLNPEMNFIELCVHGSSHYWARLHWLMDIGKILHDNTLNWDKVLNLAKKRKLEKIIFETCALAKDILSVPLPFKASDAKLTGDFITNISSHEYFAFAIKLKVMRHRLRFQMTPYYNWPRLCMKYFYKTSEWDKIRLPKQLYYSYFLFRPILIFFKVLTLIPGLATGYRQR
ncbi:hypothetical protein LNTAR_14567 [Lentisphaera araneosa HTCC2155]|uniref:Nucleotidyltransferase family protein n=1 Tax=Lentisphaera araneosa HTCC2155 TaxID=313628 RepID=A6DHG5_9BACT|nr:nucleotidyltransferase family protein [Lentisphaera araneosa]EDM29048.1 hypothetical protein LNTAR_14567 [Lentisphaera araneosa HTCC2155]